LFSAREAIAAFAVDFVTPVLLTGTSGVSVLFAQSITFYTFFALSGLTAYHGAKC
jgi:hypothetical protein